MSQLGFFFTKCELVGRRIIAEKKCYYKDATFYESLISSSKRPDSIWSKSLCVAQELVRSRNYLNLTRRNSRHSRRIGASPICFLFKPRITCQFLRQQQGKLTMFFFCISSFFSTPKKISKNFR